MLAGHLPDIRGRCCGAPDDRTGSSSNLQHSGRRLGARDGTGPEDDVLMRFLRNQSRAEGKAEGLAESEKKIGKLLGYSQVQTTARYAHLARDSVKASAARIADGIGADILVNR